MKAFVVGDAVSVFFFQSFSLSFSWSCLLGLEEEEEEEDVHLGWFMACLTTLACPALPYRSTLTDAISSACDPLRTPNV